MIKILSKLLKKQITADNLHTHKMSVIFDKVANDIQMVRKLGLKLYMPTYGGTCDGRVCTVCLGGAAAMGLIGKKDFPKFNQYVSQKHVATIGEDSIGCGPFATFINNGNEEKVTSMMKMFDCFRTGDFYQALHYYNYFAENKIPQVQFGDIAHAYRQVYDEAVFFTGDIEDDQIDRLIEAITKFRDTLKKFNF